MKRYERVRTLKVTIYCYGIILAKFKGGVPQGVWDRLGITAHEDTLSLQSKVCIGLNLNNNSPPLPTHRRTALQKLQTAQLSPQLI